MKLFSFGVTSYPSSLELKGRYSWADVTANNAVSVYTDTAAKRMRRAQALLEGLSILFTKWTGVGRPFRFGYTVDNLPFAEVVDEDGSRQVAVLDAEAGKLNSLFASVVKPDGTVEGYTPSTRKGTVVFLTVLAKALEEGELSDGFKSLTELMDKGAAGIELGCKLALLSSNLYYRSKINVGDKNSLAFVPGLEDFGYINPVDFSALIVKNCVLDCIKDEEYGGVPLWMTTEEKPEAEAKAKAPEEKEEKPEGLSLGGFSISERELTKEEEALVPAEDKKFIVSRWMVSILRKVCSNLFKKPFRNLLLIGEAGCGKSKFSMAFARAINRPHLRFVCGPDTTQIDLLGGILPRTGKTLSLDDVLLGMGEMTTAELDKEISEVNAKLSENPEDGEVKGKLETLTKKGEELTKKGLAEMKKMEEGGDFVFQKSPIIEAIEKGWVIEIQEPTVIKRPSVLVSLNALLEDDLEEAKMTLANGEVIQRHPDAVVIMTANPAYVGCSPIQQSVLSRMQLVKRLESPSAETMVQRILAETGCSDKKAVTKMTIVLREMSEYCKGKGITDGTVGMRELSAWVKSSMEEEFFLSGKCKKISEDSIIRAAFDTVLTHVSQEEEDIKDVLGAVFEKTFSISRVEELLQEANS